MMLPPEHASPLKARDARDCLILALDLPSAAEALAFLENLERNTAPADRLLWVKVGLEIFVAAGPSIVTELLAREYRVFLDLKLHDIPNTVAGAVRSAASLGADLLTVHASGGPAMMAAAAKAASATTTRLLAVTVLTSMDAHELAGTGVAAAPAQQVALLARAAADAGIAGLVCSGQEAATLRALLPHAHLVTPGIRPPGSASGDQQRLSTPAQALRDGASQLVVGRPITQAADPAGAYRAVLAEIRQALTPGDEASSR